MSRIPSLTDSIRLGEVEMALESLLLSIELQMPLAWVLEAIVEGSYEDLPKSEDRQSCKFSSITTALECLDKAKVLFEQSGLLYLYLSIRLLLVEAKGKAHSELEENIHEQM